MKIQLISPPAAKVDQHEQEQEFWKWHYALKSKLTYPNLNSHQLSLFGNTEHQNIGLLSIAKTANDDGHSVNYNSPMAKHSGDMDLFLDDVYDSFRSFKPDYVGFSSHTPSIPVSIEIARKMKSMQPRIKTIVGGPHATGVTGKHLKELAFKFDYVVKGLGNIPIKCLLSNTDNITHCKGISSKNKLNESSNVQFDAQSSLTYEVMDIDELPAARVYSSYGCRQRKQCSFCGDIIHNKKFLSRDVDIVLNEIKYLYNNYHTRYFYFGDENFFLMPIE